MAFLENRGFCLTCDTEVTFSSEHAWLRDHYHCPACGSIPRERALMWCLEQFFPNWRELAIHESSPVARGASAKLQRQAKHYLPTQYYPGFPAGQVHPSGFRCEDLQRQTFPDAAFDLVVTQDVMEHVLDPGRVFAEIARTLRSGGAHVFTVPLVNKGNLSRVRAARRSRGLGPSRTGPVSWQSRR